MRKEIKGEKYIYLAMAYRLAKESGLAVQIGNDNRMVGGQNFIRHFHIQKYDNQIILVESKSSKHFADFSRCFDVRDIEGDSRVRIYEYFNEAGENCSNRWVH